ncbi:hypothetical protein NMY22_g8744 [Coprinellus aureogranulatus]|nr:hypothetical protein NMY22_g8744 [Coprinellus aureogranulatus]
MTGHPNNRNYNRQHHIRGQPREPSPPPLVDPPLMGPDGPEDPKDDPKLNWYYGQDAGGFVLTFGKHKGKALKEVPYSYLKWCMANLERARSLRSAIQKYDGGLKKWIAEGNYGEVVVPVGRTYKGMPLKKCRDKEWMKWLVQKSLPTFKERHELFFLAIDGWLKNPPHQLAKRDIGESLAKTKYYDDLNLDLEEGEEFDDSDADENGNLAGFIEPDTEETGEESQSGAAESEEEEEFETEDSCSSDESGQGEDESTAQSDNENDEDRNPTPPPITPLKRKRNIVLDSDSEPEFDRTSAYDGSPLKRLRRKVTP